MFFKRLFCGLKPYQPGFHNCLKSQLYFPLYLLAQYKLQPYTLYMLWGKEEPTITRELGSHVRRQGPWKPVSVPNRFGINGKDKTSSSSGYFICKILEF